MAATLYARVLQDYKPAATQAGALALFQGEIVTVTERGDGGVWQVWRRAALCVDAAMPAAAAFDAPVRRCGRGLRLSQTCMCDSGW
jgi:hypothetical protein